MENQNPEKEDIIDSYRRQLKENLKDFCKVPQEHHTNPRRGMVLPIKRLIQPHNYRLYFSFDKASYNPTIPYSVKNHNSEHHFVNFYGCYLIVRKKTIEVINLWHQKQWRLIEANTLKEIDARIDEIKIEMEETCIKVIKKFIDIHGGSSDLKPIRKREPEIGIHGDDYLDKIPKSMIIHDTAFKKVYPDKVEMFGFSNIKNYISSRAKEDFMMPEIREIREEIRDIKKYVSPLKFLKTACRSVQDIIDNKEAISLLSQAEITDFSAWTFSNFDTPHQ
jgi:hypothetical protein